MILSGTPFGDLTSLGGLAAAFNGDLTQNNPDFGAYKSSPSGYVGLALGTPAAITSAKVYGWDDRGLIDDGTSGTVYIYGKNGAPASATDGTLLAQQAFTEPSPIAHGGSVDLTVTDPTEYSHVWAYITGNGGGISIAEVVFEAAAGGGTTPPPSGDRPLAIFLGSGQSNMYGNADVPAQTVYGNRDRLKMFALDGTIKPAADPLMDATGSLWPTFNVGVPQLGPLMPFGNHIVSSFKNFDVLLVNSSKGSTAIEEWDKPGALYDAMIDRASTALSAAPYGSFIAGFVWQQAESNCYSETTALAWPSQFSALISNVRGDLSLPNLPVVMIGLGPAPGGSLVAWPMLRAVQRFMSLPGTCVYVYTADLPNAPTDADWHTTASVLTIGERAADAMRPMLPQIA